MIEYVFGKNHVGIEDSSQFHTTTISNLILNQTAHIQMQTGKKANQRDAGVTLNSKQWQRRSHWSGTIWGGD